MRPDAPGSDHAIVMTLGPGLFFSIPAPTCPSCGGSRHAPRRVVAARVVSGSIMAVGDASETVIETETVQVVSQLCPSAFHLP